MSESIEETTDEFHATVTMSAFLKPFFVFRTVIHGWVAGEL